MPGSENELRNRIQRAAIALSQQTSAGKPTGPSAPQRAAALVANAQQKARSATAAIAQQLGSAKPVGLPARLSRSTKKIGQKLVDAPQKGVHPGRYWPVLMIAAALAESAHAPSISRAQANFKTPEPFAHQTDPLPRPPAGGGGKTDMHGPAYVHKKSAVDDPKKPDDAVSPELLSFLFPAGNHGDGGFSPSPTPPIQVHGDGDGGVAYFDPGSGGTSDGGGSGYQPASGGGSSGGSGSGGGGGGGGGGAGGGGTATIDSSVQVGLHSDAIGPGVAVPEPGCLSILMTGSLLLGRRRSRRSL